MMDSLPLNSLRHGFIDSLIRFFHQHIGSRWFTGSLLRCFIDSFTFQPIDWFIGSSFHWFILSYYFTGISAAIFSFVDAPYNFKRRWLLHFKNTKTVPTGHWFPIVAFYFEYFRPGACRALFGNLNWEDEPDESHVKFLIFSVCFQPTIGESQPSWGFPLYLGRREQPIATLFLVENFQSWRRPCTGCAGRLLRDLPCKQKKWANHLNPVLADFGWFFSHSSSPIAVCYDISCGTLLVLLFRIA